MTDLVDMVGHFGQILETQIFTMMVDRKKHHIHKSSGQSVSATSTGIHGHCQPADIEYNTFAFKDNPDHESSVDSNETD